MQDFFFPASGQFLLKNVDTKIAVKTWSKPEKAQDKVVLMLYLGDWHRRIPTLLSQKLGEHVLRGVLANIKSFQFKETLEII